MSHIYSMIQILLLTGGGSHGCGNMGYVTILDNGDKLSWIVVGWGLVATNLILIM